MQSFNPIIYEIVGVASLVENWVLAQHPKTNWGFTDEEIDDLINYTIKYRMDHDSKSKK